MRRSEWECDKGADVSRARSFISGPIAGVPRGDDRGRGWYFQGPIPSKLLEQRRGGAGGLISRVFKACFYFDLGSLGIAKLDPQDLSAQSHGHSAFDAPPQRGWVKLSKHAGCAGSGPTRTSSGPL